MEPDIRPQVINHVGAIYEVRRGSANKKVGAAKSQFADYADVPYDELSASKIGMLYVAVVHDA